MTDHKNLILAVVLSIVILVGWQFLFPPDIPTPSDEPAGDFASETIDSGLPVAPGADLSATGDPLPVDRDQVLGAAGRIPIDTAHLDGDRMRGLHGSISLQGGRLDDLTLVGYHETVDPASPEIVVLSPRGSLDAYFAEVGWTADGALVPNSETVWSTNSQRMQAHEPVVLTWDNGEGLTFERIYMVDDNYLFTVTQRVINSGTETSTLRPFSNIGRFYRPDTLGFFILHEGPYGVFDETLEEFSYGDLEDDQLITTETTGGWLSFTDKYWLVAAIPDQSATVTTQFAYQSVGAQDRYYAGFAGSP